MSEACTSFLPALVDAAEGQISPELEAHLPGCAACRAELSELGASLEAIAPPPAPEPGPWLAPKIRAHHEASAPRQRMLRWALPALVPLALIVTVVVSGPTQSGLGAGLGSLDAIEAELAKLDPTELETFLGAGESDAELGANLGSPEDPLQALATALAETDEELLETVLAETSLGYDDETYDDAGLLDAELELILEAIPG